MSEISAAQKLAINKEVLGMLHYELRNAQARELIAINQRKDIERKITKKYNKIQMLQGKVETESSHGLDTEDFEHLPQMG